MGLEPGDQSRDFELLNANANTGSKKMNLGECMGENGLVVVFECNHCPYVVASFARLEHMANVCRDFGIGFIGINSNDSNQYPDDSFENMQKRAEKGMNYPYLHDESQSVAEDWGAERTPEVYLLNNEGVVIYRGRIDNSPRDPNGVSKRDLMDAIDAHVMGEKPPVTRTKSIGCSVKWKM
jgi:peroxiredoxin